MGFHKVPLGYHQYPNPARDAAKLWANLLLMFTEFKFRSVELQGWFNVLDCFYPDVFAGIGRGL